MNEKKMIDQLLYLLPYWHYKIERPLKQLQKNSKISFETYYCLKILSTGKQMSMTELAQYLHMSKQQITKMTNTLCEYDFLKRIYDPKDRRIIKVKITPKALQYMEEVSLNEQFLDSLKNEFSESQIKQLEQCIQTLIEVVTNNH